MLYAPMIYGESLMDDWFDDFDRDLKALDKEFNRSFGGKDPLFGRRAKNLMKTDVREHDDSYEVDIDLPGFKKDEVNIELTDGYLVVEAQKGLEKENKDKKGKLIRQERYSGSMTRSFYVGDAVKQEDIKARMEHGVLKLTVPKAESRPAVEEKKYIAIEG